MGMHVQNLLCKGFGDEPEIWEVMLEHITSKVAMACHLLAHTSSLGTFGPGPLSRLHDLPPTQRRLLTASKFQN